MIFPLLYQFVILVISLCIFERGNKILYIRISSEIVAGLHDMILLVDGHSAILLFVESGHDGRFESCSIFLHASYLILILFNWDDI
jgi:hypothetical protein